jgi:bifunctional non-homologous end joining protein LigD
MLPQVAPMLATPSAPFDSDAYAFEIKWNGIRALAAVDDHGWRLWGRGQADYTTRYPELEMLRGLPAGTLLDGELVTLAEGLPDLGRLLRRHGLVDPWKIGQARHWCPVQFIVFDLLYERGHSLLRAPWRVRQEALAECLRRQALPGVWQAPGVVGAGQAYYAAAVALGHEGIMAKSLAAPYRPGRRGPAWRKIKPRPSGGPRGGR